GRIETLDACQIELKQLHRTDLACVEELQLFGGWRKRKLLIGHWSSPFDQPSKFVRPRARQKPEENIYRTNGADRPLAEARNPGRCREIRRLLCVVGHRQAR